METVSPVRILDDQLLLDTCHTRSIQLLKRNLVPGGILAATPNPRSRKRGYTAIFGRDAAVCAIGMALSGDKLLAKAAASGLHTLAQHQAANGQIAKFVDLRKREADFWYVGCIDSTLWWLVALAFLDRHTRASPLRRRYAARIQLAINGCWHRSINGSFYCNKTKPATGPTSCRAPDSCCIRTRSGIA
jgi:glycogen debranching enzyme